MTSDTQFRDLPDKENKHARYNRGEKGRARRSQYRHDRSKHVTDASYLGVPFVGWDGEGVTRDGGRHDYVLLANSEGKRLVSVDALPTYEIFEFLLSNANPAAIHVIYGGNYDFNMFLSDLTVDQLRRVYKGRYVQLGEYLINWRPGKFFYLRRGDRKILMNDVVSFFQCAFVKACDDYLGDEFEDRDLIVENKLLRSEFTVDDIENITRYNDAELRNLVKLMRELRTRLNKVTLRPARWDGPGAVATALLRRERVKDCKAACPPRVAEAGRYAYAGGRFEVVRWGHVDAPAYEYDINSAYPAAMRNVPDLSVGRWIHHRRDVGSRPFAVYHVGFEGEGDGHIPGPLFCRSPLGSISYPQRVTGWYWTPEVDVARRYIEQYGGKLTITEVHEFVPGNDVKPFSFIDAMYEKRRALKAAGDGAHVGIKLGLNSLYGKLAQQVGWDPLTGRIPPYHQLEWAGYVTAHCRASVLNAALPDLHNVIAFETDALFTTAPLNVPIGGGLGEWEESRFSSLTYVQSGLYFGTDISGHEITKTRGVDRGSLTREHVVTQLQLPNGEDRYAHAQLTRFVGAGLALAQSIDRWRHWETKPKNIKLWPQGKRIHYGCDQCDDTPGETLNVWHRTLCPHLDHAHSAEFPIEWINPDPEMSELAELRELSYEVDYETAG